MNDRAFRLDFFIAVAALLISALTAGTLLYQTRVIGDQFAATIWPYLNVDTTYDIRNGETIDLANDGLGPAVIRSAQLSLEGKNLRSWDDYLITLAHEDPRIRRFFLRMQGEVASGRVPAVVVTTASIGSTTLPAGRSKTLLKIWSPVPGVIPVTAVMDHPISLTFCYCSLNGSCWTIRATPGKNGAPPPQPVPSCAATAEIESNPMPAVTAPKKLR